MSRTMQGLSHRGRRALVAAAAIAAWAPATWAPAAMAQVSPPRADSAAKPALEDQIAASLRPKPVTRSLSIGTPAEAPATSDDAKFVRALPTTRSLSVGEREKLADVSKNRPSIDLEIPFEFNSSVVGPRALPAVSSLGAALARPEFKSGTFSIAGYTDGKGSDQKNQALSERRAESVKRYLVQHYGIPSANLVTVGYGKTHLKNATNPFADENRRVQATNLSEIKSAANR